MDHPLPWLRVVDTNDLTTNTVDFDGMLVESASGEKLGHVDGFVVDAESVRPYYVVVDAGGWFKSKHFLLPVGHARLSADTDRDALVVDLPRERIDRFPGFDKDEFEKLTPDGVKRFNDDTCIASSGTAMTFSVDEPWTASWDRPDYRYPDWWSAQPTSPNRMGASAFDAMAASSTRPSTLPHAERMVAQGEGREPGEPSPHYDGRAQPGDVLGLDTGGETTGIGDTAESENERRRAAEKAAPRE